MASLLDRNYAIVISLKDGRMTKQQSSFEIYTTDANIFNIYVTLKDNTGAVIPNADLSNYECKMYVVRPDLAYKEVTATVDPDGEDRYIVDLGKDVLTNQGEYKFEFTVKKDTEIVTSSNDTFTVRPSIIEGLTQTYSMDIAVLSELQPVKAVAQLQSKKIDDVRFDGKILSFYADGECVRKCYLNKADIPLDELETYAPEVETYTAGKGISISKNNVISLNTNSLKAIIREIINEGEGE